MLCIYELLQTHLTGGHFRYAIFKQTYCTILYFYYAIRNVLPTASFIVLPHVECHIAETLIPKARYLYSPLQACEVELRYSDLIKELSPAELYPATSSSGSLRGSPRRECVNRDGCCSSGGGGGGGVTEWWSVIGNPRSYPRDLYKNRTKTLNVSNNASICVSNTV